MFEVIDLVESRRSVGAVIRLNRESKGLTLRTLAKDLDVPLTSLSKMESGDQKIDSEFLISMADYFGVSIDTMLNRTVNNIVNEPYKIENELDIQTVLKHVLNTYKVAKSETVKNHELGNYVRNVIKDVIIEDADLDVHRFIVKGSVGQGRWAEIPWVSVFIRDITTTATSGYYIVYLFKADMSGVYISLNQGWTYFLNKYKTKQGAEKIQATANIIKRNLNTIPTNMTIDKIDLEGQGDLAKGYENGHIFGRLYDADDLPSSKELISDLKELLTSYKEIEYMMGGRSVDQFNDYLLLSDDGHYLEEDEEQEQEEDFQDSVQLVLDNTLDEDEDLIKADNERLPRPDPVFDNSGKKRWPRDAKVAARALRLSKYKCALDESHTSFTSKVTGKRYLEMHHLVPMKYQGEFDVKLDREAQLLALCPTCHRQIHHGTDDEKEIILRKLFYDRRDRLEAIGIEIGFKELRNMYGIKG